MVSPKWSADLISLDHWWRPLHIEWSSANAGGKLCVCVFAGATNTHAQGGGCQLERGWHLSKLDKAKLNFLFFCPSVRLSVLLFASTTSSATSSSKQSKCSPIKCLPSSCRRMVRMPITSLNTPIISLDPPALWVYRVLGYSAWVLAGVLAAKCGNKLNRVE